MIEAVPRATGRLRRSRRSFHVGVAIFMILFNVIAFGPSIVDPSGRNVPLPLTPVVAAHAVVAGAWLLLFLVQATLVARGRVTLHRRLGRLGAAITVVFVVVSCVTVIEQARRGFDLSGDLAPPPQDPTFVVGGVWVVLTFGMLAGAGIICRHRPDVHKRLMLLAMLAGLTSTPVAHVVGHWPALQPWAAIIFPTSTLAFLSLSAAHDRLTSGRIHPVSLWVPLLVLAWSALVGIVLVPSAAWRAFAAWLIA